MDQGSIREFIAAAGVGLTSQYVEQFGRRLLGGLLGKIAGKTIGKLGSAGTGMAFSFASTYALGQLARRYYAGSRNHPPYHPSRRHGRPWPDRHSPGRR